jgi:hypothetical protein
MSGPKVVRIVTREELQAIARAQLRRFETATEDFIKFADRCGFDGEKLQAEMIRRRESLEALYRKDRWADLETQSGLHLSFLKSETDRLEAEAIAAAKKKREKRFRLRDAAVSMISAYEAAGRKAPPELREIAARSHGADESELAEFQSRLNSALNNLHPAPAPSTPTAKQKELATALGSGVEGKKFSEWLAAQSLESDESLDKRLKPLLAEIEALDDPSLARSYFDRINRIAEESRPNQRALLTDSLVLEIASRCKARRAEKETVARLRELQASLAGLGSTEANAMAEKISNALEFGDAILTKELMAEAEPVFTKQKSVLAAEARRKAVLEGLAKLGYEVKENLSTAWVKDGRVIVTKPGIPDYGVEIGAPADVSRMQVRLVGSDRPASTRDRRRDTDMETIWCSEFQSLKDRLKEKGSDVILERAVGVGVEPVKSVSLPSSGHDAHAAKLRSRTSNPPTG